MYNIKFKLDQDIYYISQSPEPKETYTCNICHGKRHVKINEETFKCPKCNGTGRIVTEYSQKWVPSRTSSKILRIRIEPDLGNHNKDHLDSKILYVLYPSYYSIPQEQIFSTFEEAFQQCNKLNKE